MSDQILQFPAKTDLKNSKQNQKHEPKISRIISNNITNYLYNLSNGFNFAIALENICNVEAANPQIDDSTFEIIRLLSTQYYVKLNHQILQADNLNAT